MRKLVFITICATRGTNACRTSPKMPMRVAMRTHLTAVRSRSLADKETEQTLHEHGTEPTGV